MTVSLPTPKLIIFDCDGTLVDTELLHTQIFAEQLEEKGLIVDINALTDLVAGTSLASSFETIPHHFNIKYDEKDAADYLARFRAALQKVDDSIAIPRARDIVVSCAARLPVAIATNGEVDLTDIKLRACGYFDVLPDLKVYTKDLVAKPKPAPDLYLHVAEQFGVAPGDCWVVEDTAVGAKAGVAAGMNVIGITICAHDRNETAAQLQAAGVKLVIEDYESFPTF